jgi:hypothetical protein
MSSKVQIICLIFSMILRSSLCSSCADPCVGGSGCENGGPQTFVTAITGPGAFSYAWSDPSSVASVDLYEIDMAVDDGGLSCAGSTIGAACSLSIPQQGSVNGICDASTSGSIYCWIPGYLGSLIAYPWAQPCDRTSNPTCNSGSYIGVAGVHYYLRISAGRCCNYGILQTPGCSTCPEFNTDICPMSPYTTTDIVAMGKHTEFLHRPCQFLDICLR